MRKKYAAIIIFSSLFLFTEVKSAENIPKAIAKLQIEVKILEDKIKLLENDLTKIRDVYKATKSNEASILKLIARFRIFEKKHKESSAETINTLKEAIATLRKRVEDQDVTMHIFEKKYNILQKPLEPLQKSIKNQTNTISKIVVKLDDQEQIIKSLSKKTGFPITGSETIHKAIDNEAVLDQIIHVKAEIKIANFLNEGDHYDIGGGLYAKKLMFEPFGTSVEFSGIILNASERDVNVANLSIYIHDEKDKLIWDKDFRISGIKRGYTKFFSEILSGIKIKQIEKYALVMGFDAKPIEFLHLRPDALPEKKLNVSEKKREEEKEESTKNVYKEFKPVPITIPPLTNNKNKETVGKTPDDEQPSETPTLINHLKSEQLQEASAPANHDKEEQLQETSTPADHNQSEIAKKIPEDEQLKVNSKKESNDSSRSSFMEDVTVTSIDSGIKISGVLRNTAGDFHNEEQILVMFFGKKKEHVHMHNFTVSGIENKFMVEFSETITGLSTDDFDSYEIKFLCKDFKKN